MPCLALDVCKTQNQTRDTIHGGAGRGGGDAGNRVVGANAETACFSCHQPQEAQDYVFSQRRD